MAGTPLSTQALIEHLIERVQDLLPGIEVARYPGNQQDYRLTHPQGAVLIAYTGAQGGEARLERGAHQWLLHQVRLALVNRTLWEADGLLDHLDRLRAGLIGWQASGAQPLSLRAEALLQSADGLWWCGADYQTRQLLAGVHP